MSARAVERTSAAGPLGPRARRLAAGFTFAVLLVGCAGMWVGVPVGGFWLAGRLTSTAGTHAVVALALVIPGMLAAAVLLAWIDSLWLRITGGEIVEVRGLPVRRKGPLETLLPICGILALIALVVWFFLFAENPSNQFL